jgi:methyl-accepting chemotaxis protein
MTPSRWYDSLRWKLLVIYLAISILPLLFFFNTMLVSTEEYFRDDKLRIYSHDVNIMASHLSEQDYFEKDYYERYAINSNYLEERSRDNFYRILVLDDKGFVVSDTNRQLIGQLHHIPEVIEAFSRRQSVRLRTDERAVYAAAVIQNRNSDHPDGVVLIVASVVDMFEFTRGITNQLLVVTTIIVLMVLALVVFTSQSFLRPLNVILKVIQKITQGYHDQRIEVSGRDEFAI